MSLGNQLRVMDLSSGLRTEFGTLLPPGAQVAAYVRSTGPQTGDDMDIRQRLVTTLNAGLAKCRSGAGDVVMVLPNHAENISSADQMSSLVAGTTIIGCGAGNTRPTFTWSAATATFLFDVANVTLTNCILKMAGPAGTTALSVAAPITVSAAGCSIVGNTIQFGIDADQLATIGITTTAAGDDFTFADNFCYGDTAAEVTTFLRLVGADRALIARNEIVGATSAVAVGLVQFITTDSLDVRFFDNSIRNNKAASTAAVTVSAGATSSAGWVDRVFFTVLGNGANQLVLGHADGAWAASVGAFTFGRFVNVANLAGERAAEVTVVSA